MAALAEGNHDALGPLYTRHAATLFRIAANSLESATAEELVQEIFLAVWRKAHTYDPGKGPFRPWLLQIAHLRVVNELRAQSRRPRAAPESDAALMGLTDPAADPFEIVSLETRRAAITTALQELPSPQRRAVSLAFLENLSHSEVAQSLAVPLGTAKTRIRGGLKRLRPHLVSLVASGLAILAISAGAVHGLAERSARERAERALATVSSSDLLSLRMDPVAGPLDGAHGRVRIRPGAELSVVTLTDMPALESGFIYRVWSRVGVEWTRLTDASVDSSGRALIVLDRPEPWILPNELVVSREPTERQGIAPSGEIIARWLAAGMGP
ncbi:MAG: sigma-70 family RNA polymerase sigma factor [Chloroflexota bacterium]